MLTRKMVREIEQATNVWMDKNPRQKGETARQYAQRAWDSTRDNVALPRRRVGVFDWSIFTAMIIRFIEMLIDRRRSK